MKRIIYIIFAAFVLSFVPVTKMNAQGSAGHIETPRERKVCLEREAAAKKKRNQEAALKKREQEAREQVVREQREREAMYRREREEREQQEREAREQWEQMLRDENIDKFKVVEQQPTFREDKPDAWFAEHMQYPVEAAKKGIQGRVIVGFIVELDGSISNVCVLKSDDPSLVQEAVRLVKSMPKWNPAMEEGNPIRVAYWVHVNFKL